ncbi:hypothetical protein B0H63DRAFT_456146 [Podospora didyma]|uniref:Uncharacterized protein n=1 Tax=Podospora didyma TaxID=330526 RepID=A0AAE0JY07_9PEZI|nr:hypothetical protein B0H63DRAFT_456146 [Podospora didyma]
MRDESAGVMIELEANVNAFRQFFQIHSSSRIIFSCHYKAGASSYRAHARQAGYKHVHGGSAASFCFGVVNGVPQNGHHYTRRHIICRIRACVSRIFDSSAFPEFLEQSASSREPYAQGRRLLYISSLPLPNCRGPASWTTRSFSTSSRTLDCSMVSTVANTPRPPPAPSTGSRLRPSHPDGPTTQDDWSGGTKGKQPRLQDLTNQEDDAAATPYRAQTPNGNKQAYGFNQSNNQFDQPSPPFGRVIRSKSALPSSDTFEPAQEHHEAPDTQFAMLAANSIEETSPLRTKFPSHNKLMSYVYADHLKRAWPGRQRKDRSRSPIDEHPPPVEPDRSTFESDSTPTAFHGDTSNPMDLSHVIEPQAKDVDPMMSTRRRNRHGLEDRA